MNKLTAISIFIVAAATISAASLRAETAQQRSQWRHEVRIGWGDQMFEKKAWQNPQYIINNMPNNVFFDYKENYRYNQHIFGEYQYRSNKWLSFGGMLDVSSFTWDNTVRNGAGSETHRVKNQIAANIVLMPTVRFSYCNIKYFSVYSGVGLGIDINTGSEMNGYGEKTVVSSAFNLTLVGAALNYDRWFASAEFGGMFALNGANYIYMLASRMISVSVGIRF